MFGEGRDGDERARAGDNSRLSSRIECYLPLDEIKTLVLGVGVSRRASSEELENLVHQHQSPGCEGAGRHHLPEDPDLPECGGFGSSGNERFGKRHGHFALLPRMLGAREICDPCSVVNIVRQYI